MGQSEYHSHSHVHDPKEKKRQINRLSRVIGHLEYVKKMIENDEDCAAVLMQISATKSALNGLGKEIINEHFTLYHPRRRRGEYGGYRGIQKSYTEIFVKNR